MFDGGVSDQIHRFITSPPPPQPPQLPTPERSLPVSFSTFNTNHETQQHMMNLESRKIIHYHHHHHHHDIKDGEWMSHIDHDAHHHPWCSDEVLALLRFRSTVENWLPEFTWEHTSRKLTEIGFKRSPQECKEKYEEEERRYFSSNNNTNDHISNYNHNKGGNYKMFSDVEEFYHHDHNHDHDDVDDDDHASSEVGHNQNKSHNSLDEEPKRQGNVNANGKDLLEEDKREEEELIIEKSMKSIDVDDVDNKTSSSSSSLMMMMMMKEKKRKRKKKEKERLSVLKGFCEGLVRNMMSQQEEMHKKLLEDMLKRDKEKIARDEALKKQEMERINKEIEARAHEQAIANDRSTNIIKFISNFADDDDDHHGRNKVQSPSASQGSSSLAQSRKSQTLIPHKTPLISPQSSEPISIQTLKTKTQIPKPQNSDEKSDLGKRWPRDEVLTLVNIRRSISTMNMNDDDHNQDGISKAVPLWERISRKMLENGYKRSAKRCKEKWENINKYFRKTKDVNKKRPLDSRTCPYFHQLTALYTQVSTTTSAEELPSQDPKTRPEDPHSPAAMNVDADGTGQRSNVQYSSFDLEF